MKSALALIVLVLVCSLSVNNVESACAGSGFGPIKTHKPATTTIKGLRNYFN
jgi:hypothetical protein